MIAGTRTKPTTRTTASGDQPVGLAALGADQRAERAEPDVADHEQRRDDDDQQHPQPVAALHLVAEREDRREDDAGGPGAGQAGEVPLVRRRVDGRVEPRQPDRGAGEPDEAGDPAQGIPFVAALGEQGEREQRRRQTEGHQVGQRVELQAERGDRPDQPGDRAVGDVEDDREADQDGGQPELAADRHQDREEPAEHVGQREQARQRGQRPPAGAAHGAADERHRPVRRVDGMRGLLSRPRASAR